MDSSDSAPHSAPVLTQFEKNRIFAELAPRSKGRFFGVGSLQSEASDAASGSQRSRHDPDADLQEQLRRAEAALQASQAEVEASRAALTASQQEVTAVRSEMAMYRAQTTEHSRMFAWLEANIPNFSSAREQIRQDLRQQQQQQQQPQQPQQPQHPPPQSPH